MMTAALPIHVVVDVASDCCDMRMIIFKIDDHQKLSTKYTIAYHVRRAAERPAWQYKMNVPESLTHQMCIIDILCYRTF